VSLTWKRWATGYPTPINEALRQHVEGKAPKFEETLRRIVRAVLLWGQFFRKETTEVCAYVQNVHIMECEVAFEWDARKAEANYLKHGVRFAEADPVFKDDDAITITDDDSDPHEVRFVSIGMGAKERVLVVVYCHRGENIRIISARVAEPHERSQYEELR
jgi:hypothetical protein